MRALIESWRGSTALLRWVLGMPLANLRVLGTTRDRKQAQDILAQRSQRALATCRITIEVSGTPPPPGTGCVLVYNETSFADVLAFTAIMWQHLDRASAADVYAWIPFGRAASRRGGIALVPRGNRTGTERLLTEMVEAAKAGERVAWGGEGRLSGRDDVLRFKVGASLIAIRAAAPLVPVAFHGGHQAIPLGSLRARPGVIRVRFGQPLSTTGLDEDRARDLSDRAQAVVTAMYGELASA
jgi:1-acyl-sn-glycerol-3-phosphate acyltransferase